MKEFNLKDLAGNLIQDLKSSVGAKNVIRLGVADQLPLSYLGDPAAMTKGIKDIVLILADTLVLTESVPYSFRF